MKNKTEFAIGEEVQMGLVTLVCVEAENKTCYECELYHINDSRGGHCSLFIGNCWHSMRTDNKNVIFKLKDNGKD